ncbi:MAG: fused MFS/spermidine synthase [Nitrospirales bacterium]
MNSSRQQASPSRGWYFWTAFTTGAVVMALEILGSRLIAPIFGSSLYVWGALIGVVLAAMSSGYAAGGWFADRRSPVTILALLLLASGIWTLLLAWVGQPVVFTVSRWVQDPRWGPCLAAGVLLALPAFCLSGVLPALLRLATADMGHLGRHTGSMIAVSTIGSLVGTWGTSFYLLTWLGSMTLAAILGIAQVVLGFLWTWWAWGSHWGRTIPVFGLVAFLGWSGFHPVVVQPPALHQEDSPYQQVRVRDIDRFRFLILNNTFHAVMEREAPVHLALPYSHVMMGHLPLVDNPKRGLILGHGGGSLAKWLAQYWPDLEMDVVEMDPSVVHAAEEYFEYTPPANHHVFVQDARTFLGATPNQYDIVWVDVFARHLIPFHVTTEEFFAELRSHMTSDGVMAVNLASSDAATDIRRARAVYASMQTSFPNIEIFSVAGPKWLSTSSGSVNLIFFSGTRIPEMHDPSFSTTLIEYVNQKRLPVDTLTYFHSTLPIHLDPGIILTDDFSPLDILQGQG